MRSKVCVVIVVLAAAAQSNIAVALDVSVGPVSVSTGDSEPLSGSGGASSPAATVGPVDSSPISHEVPVEDVNVQDLTPSEDRLPLPDQQLVDVVDDDTQPEETPMQPKVREP